MKCLFGLGQLIRLSMIIRVPLALLPARPQVRRVRIIMEVLHLTILHLLVPPLLPPDPAPEISFTRTHEAGKLLTVHRSTPQ